MNTKEILSNINEMLRSSASAGMHIGEGRHTLIHGVPYYTNSPLLTLHHNYRTLETSIPSENASKATVVHEPDSDYSSDIKPLQVFHDVPITWMHDDGDLQHSWEVRHRTRGLGILENHNLTNEEIRNKKLEESSIYDLTKEGKVFQPHSEDLSSRFSHSSELINHLLSLPAVGHFYGRVHGKSPLGRPVKKSTLMDHYDLSRHRAAMSAFPHSSVVHENPNLGAYLPAEPRYLRMSTKMPSHMLHVIQSSNGTDWSHYAYNPSTEQLHHLQSFNNGQFDETPEF